jgi:hypothetical protein
MKAAVYYNPGDVRIEAVAEPGPLVTILHELTRGVRQQRSQELERALSALGCTISVGSDREAAEGMTAPVGPGYTIFLNRSVTLGDGRTLHPDQGLAVFQSPNGFWYLRPQAPQHDATERAMPEGWHGHIHGATG